MFYDINKVSTVVLIGRLKIVRPERTCMETEPNSAQVGEARQAEIQPQPELPEGWKPAHAVLLTLFERLPQVDQKQMIAIAHQKLRLRQLREAEADEQGDGAGRAD